MKRFLALLLALSLCFGMLPMPGLAETAEETQEAVLEEDIPDETVEAAEPTEPSEEVLEETFAAEEALPESGPALVITEQPEDTLTVEGVAYFAVSAQVEQDGQVLEEAEVSFQWQHLDGDTWVTLEGETGEIFAVEAPEVGDIYRCLVTWEDLEAVSEAAAVVGEEAPLDYTSEVWINPAYRDLYSEEDFSDAFEISTNASAISCSSREAALAAIRAAMVKREPVITLELNYSYGSLDDEVEALTAHMYDHNGDPKQGDYLGYAVGRYGYSWGGRQFFLHDIKYYTTAAQELQADAAVEQILVSLNLDSKTDLQKINAIYNWLVRNVKYVSDAELADQTNLAKYAGYAALVQKKAVCQGYAGAFYRLCMEAGVDSRIISCQAMNHAWNIVRVGDRYYHLDATWDAYTPDSWKYYLKGTVNWLKDHQSSTTNYISELGDQFQDSGFASDYPVPEEDYNSLALSPDGTLTLHADDPAWRQSYSTQVLNGKTVTTAPWGKKAEEVRKVVIEEGVTGISANAFYGCSNLESVEFPASLRTVGRNAFDGCGLTSVTLGANVELVESYAFQNNPGLTSVTFEGTSTQVQNFSFEKSPVENLTLPAGLKLTFGALGSQSSVQSLKHLTLTGSGPMADYTSSQSATWGYSGLETVTFAPGITTVGAYAFVNCVQLKSNIQLPAALTKIGEGAFYTSYYIPGFTFTGSQVPEIGDTAFASIQSLTCAYPCAWAAAPNSNFGARAITWQQAAHSLTHHEAQAPAAGKDGWLEYWQCDVCGRYYLTESAEAPVAWENIRQVALPAEKGCQIAFDGNTTEELLGSMTPIQAPRDADVTLPECNFTVFGYTFTGWNTQADGKGKTYQPGDTVRNLAEEGTVTLYAQWKLSTYRLVFRPGTEEGTYTGSTNAMEGLVNGETYQMPQNGYSRLGYTFVGWYREGWPDDLLQPGEDFRFTKVEQGAEIAFIAQWKINTYRAVFLPGAEEDAFTGSVAPMEDLENGKQYTLPKNRYTRPGYIFAGWIFDGTTYAEGERFTVHGEEAETLEFAACWAPITYTVRFNANKGTGKMADQKDIAFDTPTELAKNTFTRKGYHFVGWNTKANGTGEEVAEADNLTTKKSAVVTLYAMWEANEYTVVFHGPDGAEETQTMTYDRNEVLDTNPFEKAGYTFAKWNTQENGKGKAYTNNAKVKNLSTGEDRVDLFAQWTPNKYTVEFHSNLAKDTVKKQTLTYDGKQTALTANSFTWKGHSFQGWMDENGVKYENKELVQNLTTEKTVALYAQWKVNEYTVVFDGNGAEGEDVKQLMTYDVAADLKENTFTRPGYDFSGWATTAKGKAVHVDQKTVKNLTDKDGVEIRLYAVWTPHAYTVVFEKGDDAATGTMKPQKMTYGKATALTNVGFKRAGYAFRGWKLGEKRLPNKAKVKDLTTENTVTLTAQWIPTYGYTVTFAPGASDATGNMDKAAISAVNGKEYAPKACAFKRTGYVFDCWCLPNGTVITTKEKFSNLGQKENDEVTLTAVWKPITYKIRFNANKGTGKMADQTGLVYDEVAALNANAFTRSGYTFAGWNTKANGSGVPYADRAEVEKLTATNNGTVTLYAQWTKNP